MKRLFPILGLLTAGLLSYALYQALVVAPTDQLQGDVYRIIYYHVPSAWTAFVLFFINFAASLAHLSHRNRVADRIVIVFMLIIVLACCIASFEVPRSPQNPNPASYAVTGIGIALVYLAIRKLMSPQGTDVLALTTAEVGVVFCAVVLITGPIWARPVWGIWWTWDLRLTSTLVVWLIYVAYLMLRRFSTSSETAILAAAFAILGALVIPFVILSIWFFRTQHPQPVIGGGGSIDPGMSRVLLLNWMAFMSFAFLVCWSRYRLEMVRREVEEMQSLESLLEPGRVR